MTLYIDDSLMTGMIATPFREGWLESDLDVQIVSNLTADRIGTGDVALISVAEAASLVDTHFIDPAIAVAGGNTPESAISAIVMRTPVRPDGVDETPIRMIDTTPTAELLIRALLRPYFGITGAGFVYDSTDPAAAEAQVVVLDGPRGLTDADHGYQEDLAKAWYVLTGTPVVYAVAVVGIHADGGEKEIAVLNEALAIGQERRRDVRRILAGDDDSVDRDRMAAMTNGLRYELDATDVRSASNLLSRGTWGTSWRRQLPAVK